MRFYFVATSRNRKTGPIPVVTATADTCPTTCALKGNGCYAEHGHLGMFWARLNKGNVQSISFDELLTKVRALPVNQLWRYGQAGDLPPKREDVLALARANRGRPVIIYTHGRDFETYREAQKLGMHINLSADDLDEADRLADTGLSVAVVIHSKFHRRDGECMRQFRERLGGSLRLSTPRGRPVAICPQTYTEVTCLSCGLCAKARKNGTIIGFPAHSRAKALIDTRLTRGSVSAAGNDSRVEAHLRVIRGAGRGDGRTVHRGGLHPPQPHHG